MTQLRFSRRYTVILLILAFSVHLVQAQQLQPTPLLSAKARTSIDKIVNQSLASSGVPSVSIAVVKDGKIAYLQAYGNARLNPNVLAKPNMAYFIGSISKQFTATAILLLAEQGKLSLDDPVSRFFPNLTRANEVTIRELLSHTSGYQDFWPQDYVPLFMYKNTDSMQVLNNWARKPLDFDPGMRWEYSNTNYTIAGLIVEKVSGISLMDFLTTNIFTPLNMQGVININHQYDLGKANAAGYMRYGIGPLRPATPVGGGWMFAACDLAMPASDLAKWDIAMMDEKILKPASYKVMGTDMLLKNGLSTHYGLGIGVLQLMGHRELGHGGEVSGYVAQNNVFPDDRMAIVVLINQDANEAAGEIADKIATLLLTPAGDTERSEARVQGIFEALQQGKIDRSLFTANANQYFSNQALNDFKSSLKKLGKPIKFTQGKMSNRGGMTIGTYTATFKNQSLSVWVCEMSDGKFEQYQIVP